MLTRKAILTMTTAAALCAAPALAFGQANTGGSSMMPQTTQTTPQSGPLDGATVTQQGERSGTSEQDPRNPTSPPSRAAAPETGSSNAAGNPSGAATGPGLTTSGGTAAAPGAPSDAAGNQRAQGNDASAPDGTPGNPPSTATQRAADSATGDRTSPDGTADNPPGTALGRAVDRTLGTNVSGAENGRAGTGAAATGAATTGMEVDSVRLREGRRASRIIGSTVYNENNESIGSVDDLIVPQEGGQPVAVLSVGGFLGIGSRLVAVPYERLSWNAERERWTIRGASRDQLQGMPEFNYQEQRG